MSVRNWRIRLAPEFLRDGKSVDGPLVLNHRRIFILPNRRGMCLALLLALQLLVATNYNNSLAFVLSFLLVNIALLGILYGYSNLAGIVVRPGRAEPVFAGDMAVFEIHLDNPASMGRISLFVSLAESPPQKLDIAPQASAQVSLAITAERRGWLELATVTLASVFPLGLFRAWSPFKLKQQVLVYPKPAETWLPFPENYGGEGFKSPQADDFHGYQSYQPGDPLSRIHWKGLAKGQGVHVKEFRGEQSGELYFHWSRTPGALVEERLSRLCRWVIDAERAGMSYGLCLPSGDVPPARGPEHARRCLRELALLPP